MVESELSSLKMDKIFNNLTDGNLTSSFLYRVIKNSQEWIPSLLSCIERAVKDPYELRRKDIGHFVACYLLSQFREKRAFPIFIKLSELPESELDFLIGDILTEDLDKFFAATYNGDLTLLKAFIENSSNSAWARTAALESLIILKSENVLDTDIVKTYLKSLFTKQSFTVSDLMMGSLVNVCADYSPSYFYNNMKNAFADGIVDDDAICMQDVEEQVRNEQNSNLPKRTSVINTINELRKWKLLDCKQTKSKTRNSHTVKEQREIGRNDLCHCGSKKKYKKCCLIHEASSNSDIG